MIPIALHQNCCICRLADRNPEAYHAINEKLIASSRASGKPPARPIARDFHHLWPDKPGQTTEQKCDSLRKSLARHLGHLADRMQEVRADEKEHTVKLAEIADEIIQILRDNTLDARMCAQQTKRAQDYMFSSNSGAHFLNFYSKIKPETDTTKGKAAIIEFVEMEKRNEA